MPEKNTQPRTHYGLKALECVAYFATICIGIALVISLIFQTSGNNIADSFRRVGECLAYVVCIWMGFYWTRRKKNIWWLVAWIVTTVVIVVVYVVGVATFRG